LNLPLPKVNFLAAEEGHVKLTSHPCWGERGRVADSPAANSEGEYAAEGKIPALRYKSEAGRGPDQQSFVQGCHEAGEFRV